MKPSNHLHRRRFLSLSSLCLGASLASGKTQLLAETAAGKADTLTDKRETELREKNISTLRKWLACTGLTRHKGRAALYADDFTQGNPAAQSASEPRMGKEGVLRMAKEVEEHPEKETFPDWGFYNARIYAAVDNPNLFCINCLGKGKAVTTDHPAGVDYKNHYTHYFKLKDGLIQAWWETTVDTPGSDGKPPWDDPGKNRPPMITFCEGE